MGNYKSLAGKDAPDVVARFIGLKEYSQVKKIIIIGGGISGLTTAYWLRKYGLDVTILEKEKRPGGSIRTEKENGYLIECGPNSTLDVFQEVDDLCTELSIIEQKIIADRTNKNRYVVRDGRLRLLPTSPAQFFTTDLWTLRGKLRLMGEPFIRQYREASEESIASFVTRRTGREFLDYAIDPFVTGVYAGNPECLSLKSCFPKMYALEQEYGGLVRGTLLGRKKQEGPKRKMRLISFRDGLQTLPDAIAGVLGDRFIGECCVTSVRRTSEGFEIMAERGGGQETFRANVVVIATPAWVTAKIMHPLSEPAAANLMQIEYVPAVIVYTGMDRRKIRHPLDGFGFLIPSKESMSRGYNILGAIWSSSIFPGRAPDGKAAFTNILGGARKTNILEYNDNELIEMTLRDLRSILHIETKPEFVQVIRHSRAIPQYNIGHQGRIHSIEKGLLNIPGLYLAGNYLNGVSVGHCISEATKLAAKIRDSM